MNFSYTSPELTHTFLLTNGLGGYTSVCGQFSAPRCDQGILVAAVKAPNDRINLVHRLAETLQVGEQEVFLSAQKFFDGSEEGGDAYLKNFSYEYIPSWTYEALGVRMTRECAMAQGENTTVVLYSFENPAEEPCTITVKPYLKFAPKEAALEEPKAFVYEAGRITSDGYELFIKTDGRMQEIAPNWQTLAYPEDEKDGRPEKGMTGCCCQIEKTLAPGETATLTIVFSTECETMSAWEIREQAVARMKAIEDACPFTDPTARRLVLSADAYIARRDSTDGKTILAGYPLFSDWGRDTMIALPGCCLATGRYDDAKSILHTFLAYEKDGLVPNLFPEGDQAPMYNTVDAALLLIDSVWQYLQHTEDLDFVREVFPTLERIIAHYRKGTHHNIGMDEDGLIYAGQGLDQVTWMDVCVQGILPTPRHGKPVEINAYWYNALKIIDTLAAQIGADRKDYATLALKVRKSFVEKFYIPEKGYLKDVVSGTEADEQIRCNQIWALAMPFSMLDAEQELAVLKTVECHLYTPHGLRTLSPEDPQYHGFYGGSQLVRDLAYHQGTTWVFPMGAYYRAYLKVYGYSEAAMQAVKGGLKNLKTMMEEGCAGQLPEIYDGDNPYEGKGCFGQAWSVGEMLRVYEALENKEAPYVG